MSITSMISSLCKDWNLITNGMIDGFSSEVIYHMENAGWHNDSVTKIHSLSSHFAAYSVVVIYRGEEYKRGDECQGSVQWYKDLSAIVTPGHKLGLLTKILG